MSTQQLTLYTAKRSAPCHIVEIALAEVKADFTRYEVDLINKPAWYAAQVNPVGEVPAIAYGGPPTPPDHPSPSSQKIAQSLVLLEFIADLYPNSSLRPKAPVLLAKARFFIDQFSKTFPGAFFFTAVIKGESFEPMFAAIEALQLLLPADKRFAVSDECTIADIAVAPYFVRMELCLTRDLGTYPEGEGKKAYERLMGDEKYERFRRYFQALKKRKSVGDTFDEDAVVKDYTPRWTEKRVWEKDAAA